MLALGGALVASTAHAESFGLAGVPYTGRVQFTFVGASMVNNEGLANGVNCLEPQASAVVREDEIPPRVTLLSAILYVGGSLIADDGPDYTDPNVHIFTTPGLRADDPADKPFVEDAARAAADTSVLFQPPGAAAPVQVSAAADSASVSVYYKPAGSGEMGNTAHFITKIDVTDVIRREGGGRLAGTYTISELLADVCYGREAVCADPPGPPTCSTVSSPHTNAAASFALLLVFEDPALPYRTIGIFDGIQSLAGVQRTLLLETGNPISEPAAGRLAFYTIEGDLGLGAAMPGAPPCQAAEFIEVDGDDDPTSGGLCLVDDDNPAGNIFNSTINVAAANPALVPPCTGDTLYCCNGDGLCAVTGVDIDRFNISPALTPGADRVRITLGTGSDRIILGAVVLEVDVFEPELDVDSQIRLLNQVGGRVQVGGPLVYSIAVSNTGNVTATDVRVQMSAPPRTSGLEILRLPAGATNQSSPVGGDSGTGVVLVSGFTVPAGQIAEVRFQTQTRCDALNMSLGSSTSIASAEVPAFTIAGPTVLVTGPGVGDCDGVDPEGPYGEDDPLHPIADRVLRGGGCAAAPSALATMVGLLLAARLARARRRRAQRGDEP